MKTLIRSSVVVVAVVGLLFMVYASGIYTQFAKAAVAYFNPSTCYTGGSSATTSPAYMTPGAATSTVTCVLGENGARSAVIAVEATASSTTQYQFGVEESMDGIDWFPVRYGLVASTSPNLAVETDGLIKYTFASSTTLGGKGALTGTATSSPPEQVTSTGNNRNHFTMEIPVRMKRIRVWTGIVPSSSFNGAVWLQIIPRQDVN